MLAVTLILPEANVANSSIQLDAEARAQKLVWSGVALGGRLKGCTVCVRRGDDGEDCDDTARNVTLSTGQFYINVPVPSRAERSAWTGAEPQLVLQPGPGCVNAETGTPVPAPLRCASFRAGTLPRVPKGTPKIRNVCSILTDLHAELVDRWGLSAAEANARLLTALRILPRVTRTLSLWPNPNHLSPSLSPTLAPKPKPIPTPKPNQVDLLTFDPTTLHEESSALRFASMRVLAAMRALEVWEGQVVTLIVSKARSLKELVAPHEQPLLLNTVLARTLPLPLPLPLLLMLPLPLTLTLTLTLTRSSATSPRPSAAACAPSSPRSTLPQP